MSHQLIGKPKNLPTEVGEFSVFKYDDQDEIVLASPVIFPLRGLAEQFLASVDPMTDPFVGRRKEEESKNGNQKGEDPYAAAVR